MSRANFIHIDEPYIYIPEQQEQVSKEYITFDAIYMKLRNM